MRKFAVEIKKKVTYLQDNLKTRQDMIHKPRSSKDQLDNVMQSVTPIRKKVPRQVFKR